MAFTKGNQLAGSRKGIKNKHTEEVRELARSLFDKAYWHAKRQAIKDGKCPPQIEGKLLAYAYGEPTREHTLNTGITVNIGFLSAPTGSTIDAVQILTPPTPVALEHEEPG